VTGNALVPESHYRDASLRAGGAGSPVDVARAVAGAFDGSRQLFVQANAGAESPTPSRVSVIRDGLPDDAVRSARRDVAPDTGPAATARERRLRALYAGAGLPRVKGEAPRVAVVGAGLAGLAAAYLLQQGGCRTAVFEAAGQVGGRIRTERAAHGAVLECGAEFVDTQHVEVLALIRHLGLPMIDLQAPADAGLRLACHFDGQHYSVDAFEAAFARLLPQIRADFAPCSPRATRRRHTPADRRHDMRSLAEYLHGLDAEPWLRRLIEVAYVTTVGLDAAEQSSLNLLSVIGASTQGGLFGDSDERYKIRDGSARLTDGLAARLPDLIHPGHRLVRLRRPGASYRLTLERGAAGSVEVDADAVVLALPFTLLRQVDLGDLFTVHKRRAIDTLGYGTNSKLMLGMKTRVWRDQGFAGDVVTDLPFQAAWECSRQRAGDPAVFTFFLGGDAGVELGHGSAEEQALRCASSADRVFPGFSAARSGLVRRVDWGAEPFASGSYTCYRPGQWTTIAGDEATRDGNVYFAGEHCAAASQGYMDGAARTGRLAAMAILRRAG
jgi:monoamine oxidase